MARFLLLLHTRLALRTTAIIVMIVGLLGVIFLALAVYFQAMNVHRDQQARLQELLTTVERTTQVACFLSDQQLAQEVVQGLLSNDIVNAVRIVDIDGNTLASGISEGVSVGSATVSREINSPFESDVSVCRIMLEPNQVYIDKLVAQSSRFIGGALLLQLLGIGLCVVLVVVRYVTRPITGLSHRLSELEAQTGQKLQAPKANRDDEIGQLVVSVNAMIDNLMQSLGAERQLRLEREVEERRYRAIFDNVEAGIFELDGQGLIRAANPAFRRLFELEASQDLEVHPIALVALISHHGSRTDSLIEDALHDHERHFEVALGEANQQRWVSLVLSPLETGRLQGVAHDITERKRAADAAEQLAVTDPLTGLGNRRGFEHRLAVITRHHRLYPERGHALLMLDFDHFKQINDTHGHLAGDHVLRRVGIELAELLGQRDYVARLGGDEFIVLLEGYATCDDVEVLVLRFMERLKVPIQLENGSSLTVSVSIGIAMIGSDTDDPRQAMQLADMAMYAAKRAGRNTWRYFRHEA